LAEVIELSLADSVLFTAIVAFCTLSVVFTIDN